MSSIRGTWTRLVSQVEPLQRSSQCLSVIENTAYLFGGELEPRKPRDDAVYLVSLDVDSSGADLVKSIDTASATRPRVGATSTTIGGKIYYFGGRGGVEMTCLESNGSFDVFDTLTSSWSVVAPTNADVFPEDRSYHSMTSDKKETIYLHAGCPAKGRLNDLWAFNVSTSGWTQLASAPGGGRGGTSIAFCPATVKLYRINGFDGTQEQGGHVDVYNIKKGEWSSIKYHPYGMEGPQPRSVATLVPIKTMAGKELLVTMFGEGSPSDAGHAGAGRMFSDVWAFDVSAERWHRVEFKDGEPVPDSRGWFDADAWTTGDGKGDRVVVHGGLHDSNERLDDVWVLQIV